MSNKVSETALINTNVFSRIKLHHGEPMLAKVRMLERKKLKFVRYSNHLRFSLRCLHNELVPKDLRPRCKVKTERCREAAHRFSRLQLQERIHLNHSTRDRIKASIDDLTVDIKKTLSTEDFAEVESLQKLRCDKIMSQVRERHVKKFNDLLRQNDKAADDQNKVVKNWLISQSLMKTKTGKAD